MPSGTFFATGDATTEKVWTTLLDRAFPKHTMLFNPDYPFCGESKTAMIQLDHKLAKNAGDRITTTLTHQLAGAGKQGNDTLEKTGESLVEKTFNINIDTLRHAVNVAGEMTQQRVSWDVLQEARDLLAEWWGVRSELFAFTHWAGWNVPAISSYKDGSGTQIPGDDTRYTGNVTVQTIPESHILRPAGLADDASLTATHTLDPALIEKAEAVSQQLAIPIRPLKYKGRPLNILFYHKNQRLTLRSVNSPFYEAMQRSLEGGRIDDNPIFTGADGRWNDTLFFSSTYVPPGVTIAGAGKANTRRAIFCGAQSILCAFGKGYGKNRFRWSTEVWDHGNQAEVAATAIVGAAAKFYEDRDGNSVPFGHLVLPTWADDIV